MEEIKAKTTVTILIFTSINKSLMTINCDYSRRDSQIRLKSFSQRQDDLSMTISDQVSA